MMKRQRFLLLVYKVFKMFSLTKYVAWSKYLAIILIYDTVPAVLKANCDFIFKSNQGTLNSWKGRCLTLIGKTQITKSFVILKFLFLFLKSLSLVDCFKLMGLIVYLTQSFKRQNATINNTDTKVTTESSEKRAKTIVIDLILHLMKSLKYGNCVLKSPWILVVQKSV